MRRKFVLGIAAAMMLTVFAFPFSTLGHSYILDGAVKDGKIRLILVKVLLEEGADPNLLRNDSRAPFREVQAFNREEIVVVNCPVPVTYPYGDGNANNRMIAHAKAAVDKTDAMARSYANTGTNCGNALQANAPTLHYALTREPPEPTAKDCVQVGALNNVSLNNASDIKFPRYRATNSCRDVITLVWRHNYGEDFLKEGMVKCSRPLGTEIPPGESYIIDAGPLPIGVISRLNWCAAYPHKGESCLYEERLSCPPLR